MLVGFSKKLYIALHIYFLEFTHSGGERAARDLELLSEKNIKAVVNCTDDLRCVDTNFQSIWTSPG